MLASPQLGVKRSTVQDPPTDRVPKTDILLHHNVVVGLVEQGSKWFLELRKAWVSPVFRVPFLKQIQVHCASKGCHQTWGSRGFLKKAEAERPRNSREQPKPVKSQLNGILRSKLQGVPFINCYHKS